MNGKPQTLDGMAPLEKQMEMLDDNIHFLWNEAVLATKARDNLLFATENKQGLTFQNFLNLYNNFYGSMTSFVPGSVLFADTDGKVAEDNAGLFYDNANNFLGINTAPEYELDVDGNVRMTGNLLVDGGNIGISTDTDLIQLANNLLTVNGALTATGVVTGSSLVTGGNVGIAGDADVLVLTANLLSVNGEIKPTLDITLATNKFVYFRDTDLGINSSADGQLDIKADTKLMITTPLVDLSGALTVAGNLTTALTQNSVPFIGASGLLTEDSLLTYNTTTKFLTLEGATATNGLIINNTGGGDPTLIFALSGTPVAQIYVDDGDGDTFKISVDGVDRLNIDPAGVDFGAIQIYQVTDNYGMQIYGYDDRSADRFDFGININGWLLANSTKYQSWGVGGTAYQLIGYLGVYYYHGLTIADDKGVYFGGGQDWTIQANAGETELHIANSTGIGTPIGKFKSDGLEILSANATSTNLIINNTGGGDPALIFADNGVVDATFGVNEGVSSRLMVGSTDLNTKVTMTWDIANQRVGIGTTAPDNLLHIYAGDASQTSNANAHLTIEDSDNTYLQFLSGATSWAGMLFGDSGAVAVGAIYYKHDDNYMRFDVNGSPRMQIISNGNVGIGTTAPLAKLHVDQLSTTAAIPAIYLDQADVSEEMIEFNTTIGVGNAIEAVGAKTLTTTHFIKVTLPGGLTRYIPCGTIA